MWNSQFGREEVKLGEYITLEADESEEGHRSEWTFVQLPDDSKLNGFLPSDMLDIVSFQPDVPGNYDVQLTITLDNESDESSYFFKAVMSEDSNLVIGEIPQHLFDAALAKESTTIETTMVDLTDDGVTRNYLAKVVSPNQTRASPTKKPGAEIKKTARASNPPSRGNLIPLATRTYTIQVSAWPSLEEAQIASKELLGNFGIDSYIQRAFFKDTDEIYYRLRVGSFPESSAAEAYAKEIHAMTNLPVWVDFIRQEM